MRTLKTCLWASAALLASAALASPAMQLEFNKLAKVPKGSELEKAACVACHLPGGTKLNPFGKDMAAAMKGLKTKNVNAAVLKKLAKLDSDKDKVTNEAELKAGTLPGDPKSKPATQGKPKK